MTFRNLFIILTLLLIALFATTQYRSSSVMADAQKFDFQLNTIRISAPWARATAPGAKVGGAYLMIKNTGTEMDVLTDVSFSAAGRTMLHQSTMKDGIMTMRHVMSGIVIKPNEIVNLKPGGFHIMMTGLSAPLVKGNTHELVLKFKTAGEIKLPLVVLGIGATSIEHANP